MPELPQYEEGLSRDFIPEDMLFCFLDKDRPCTPACVAFLTTRPEGNDYKEQGWSACSLLVNAHRGGKHLTVLAQLGADYMKHNRIKSADAVREANNPVAPVRGG